MALPTVTTETPTTFGELKEHCRVMLFPDGEATNLVIPHNKFFIDAIVDLQTWVECLQQNNTSLYPQCSTFYKCGLTVFDAPRGIVKEVSVVDRLDPDTGEEDPDAEIDWCSRIVYTEIDWSHFHRYLQVSAHIGCCLPIPLFFALDPLLCSKADFPVPTNEGLPAGLPSLPLGYSYPQESTDRTAGRSNLGVWCKAEGKIYIAPWIQSTETVVVRWDGIKRTWNDADPIDQDPLLEKAISEYVRWQHVDKFDKDDAEANRAAGSFNEARAMLIHQCREETRQRGIEVSHARGANANALTPMFYNTPQTASVSCPAGTTGSPVSVTIPAGTIGSTISVADANQKAMDEAERQAQARLDCTSQATTYWNDEQSYTAQCVSDDDNAPAPDGAPVTVVIPANTVSSTVSKALANAEALAQATSQATDGLVCTFWNSEQTYTATCPGGGGTPVTKTIAAHTYSSAISQSDANMKAHLEAEKQAKAALNCPTGTLYYNTMVFTQFSKRAPLGPHNTWCTYFVQVTIAADTFTSMESITDANTQARNYAAVLANGAIATACSEVIQISFP